MPVISRATLPEEFFDITSAQLLLQPQPQFLHAMLAKMATGKELSTPDAIGLMPGRSAGDQGANYAQPREGRLMLDDGIMSEAITVVAGLGSAPGHTIRMNRPSFADTTYTQLSREVSAGQLVSTVPVDVASEQVAITIKRFAGPYDQANSRVAPYAIEEFDSRMSIHKLGQIVGLNLHRDFDKFLDGVVSGLYDVCSVTVYPTGFTADNDATTADAMPLDIETIFRAEESLDSANIPRFANGRRMMVVHPRGLRQLKSDTQWTQLVQFHRDVNPVFESYVGTIGNVDVHKSTTLAAPLNSSSVAIYRAQMFGPGKVGIGIGDVPKVLASTDDNYGMQAKVIWQLKAGFVNLDQRFGVSVRHS